MMTMNRQMQKVIKNLGKNLDSMNVYSLLIFTITCIAAAKIQKKRQTAANYRFFPNRLVVP